MLMLFADAEEKVNKYKEKLKALGETISDDEDDGEDDEEGDADEDEDGDSAKEDETAGKGGNDVD